MTQLTITTNEAGQRLDRFLKKYLCNAPLSAVYKVIRKDLKVNGKRAKEDSFLEEGDVLSFFVPDADLTAWTTKRRTFKKAKRQFTICYEDDDMIVVSKPFGLLVHGDSTEKKDTLANQVVDYLIETGAYNPRLERTFTPSPVHRLDRNTTGLVVFGKTAESLRELSRKFREEKGGPELADADNTAEFTDAEAIAPESTDVKSTAEVIDAKTETNGGQSGGIRKFYYTIVHGTLDHEVTLRNKLLKDPEKNKGIVLPPDDEQGKYIETIVRPIACSGSANAVSSAGKANASGSANAASAAGSSNVKSTTQRRGPSRLGYSLVEVELITGRSHQIRAHLASIGHPLVGDMKYGGKEIRSNHGSWALGRTTQALHAARLIIDGREITAPLPEAWEEMQQELLGKVIVR